MMQNFFFAFITQVADRFLFRLLADTVTGGATAEGILEGVVVIEDSDDVYGVVNLASHRLDIVSRVHQNFVDSC